MLRDALTVSLPGGGSEMGCSYAPIFFVYAAQKRYLCTSREAAFDAARSEHT